MTLNSGSAQYPLFLGHKLCHSCLILIIQFLRWLKMIKKLEIVEALLVTKFYLQQSHVGGADTEAEVGQTPVKLVACDIAHVVSMRT